jgi:protein TonB
MSNTLSSFAGFPAYKTSPVGIANSIELAGEAFSKGKFEAVLSQIEEKTGTRNYLALGALVILLHGLAVVAYINRDQSSTLAPVKHEVAIEFIRPEVIPPPVVEPPPPPPPPKVQKITPPPKPVAALRTAPAEENVKPTDIAIAENREATHISGPVVAAPGPTVEEAPPAPPAPPAPKVEEPVTEATANAAYLNNPKPDYPPTAARQGWGGTVTLRARVLADGHAESVTVKKSSGRKVLDDAALAAVRNWTFVPSKRGSTPIDGWATVPVVFNPEQ